MWKISIYFTWNLTNSSAPRLSLDKMVLIVSSPSLTVDPSWRTSFPLSSTKSRTWTNISCYSFPVMVTRLLRWPMDKLIVQVIIIQLCIRVFLQETSMSTAHWKLHKLLAETITFILHYLCTRSFSFNWIKLSGNNYYLQWKPVVLTIQS